MYEGLPNLSLPDLLDEVRCFFFDHGHDLSDAARMIAGVSGEARVISLAVRLERVATLDEGIRRDLAGLHDLLALDEVREGDPIETFLLSGPGPASRKVEIICLITDLLEELLSRIDAFLAQAPEHDADLRTVTTAKAAGSSLPGPRGGSGLEALPWGRGQCARIA
jgi:hypothetical protein